MVTQPEPEKEEYTWSEPSQQIPSVEPFTIEQGKERVAEAVDRVKQAGKEVTTRPILNAIGDYFNRGIEALIGFADGLEDKSKKRDKDE